MSDPAPVMMPRSDAASLPAPLPPRLTLAILLSAAVIPYLNAGRTVLFFDTLILQDRPMAKDLTLAVESLLRSHVIPGAELAMITFAANFRLNTLLGRDGFDPLGYVVVNVLIHAINVVLLYRFLRAFGRAAGAEHLRDDRPALLVAILFAVHPIHAASVLYVVQRRGMLCMTFGLLGLLAWLRGRRETTRRSRLAWIATTVLFGMLGLKCKSTGLILPLLILAMEFCLRAGDPEAMRRWRRWMMSVTAASVLAIAGYLHVRGLLDLKSFSIRHAHTVESLTWGVREQALSQAPAALRYWKLLLLPFPRWLSIDHDVRPTLDLADPSAWCCAALHAAILIVAMRAAYRGRRATAFGILFFYLSLLPWIGTPQPVIFAEYKAYPLAMGLALVVLDKLGAIVSGRAHRDVTPAHHSPTGHSRGAIVVVIGCVIAAVALLGVTGSRNPIFSSPTRLWADVVEKAPDLFRGRYNLANALYREQRFDEAVAQYREAIRLDDDNYRPHFNLANTLRKLGRDREAVVEYLETVRLNPDHAGAKAALKQLGFEVEALR